MVQLAPVSRKSAKQIISDDDGAVEEAQAFLRYMIELGRRRTLRDPFLSTVDAMGFTPPQLHAVLWLGTEKQLTMGQLAQRVGVTDKTITGIVDRLERDGYARRLRAESDRRVVLVDLTRKGLRGYRLIYQETIHNIATICSLLEPEEREVMLRVAKRLVSASPAPASLAGG